MIALLLALAPLLPHKWTDEGVEQAKVRDTWLLATLAVGIVLLAPHALWLSLMGLWFLWRWRSTDALPSLVTWIAIGACWFALRSLPGWAWELVPYAWFGILVFHVAQVIHQRWEGMRRPWGTLASPPICAMVIALLAPAAMSFGPGALVPLAGALWLTSSWLAILATLIGLAVLYPVLWWVAGVGMLAVVLIVANEIRRSEHGTSRDAHGEVIKRWLDVMPRGRSVDGLRVRVNVWRVVWYQWRLGGWSLWLTGRGPMTYAKAAKRWAFMYDVKLPEGDAFCEPLQMVHEYGVLGLCAMAAFVWPILPHLHVGDWWTATWIIGGVLSLGHWPMRLPQSGLIWLAVSARLA